MTVQGLQRGQAADQADQRPAPGPQLWGQGVPRSRQVVRRDEQVMGQLCFIGNILHFHLNSGS